MKVANKNLEFYCMEIDSNSGEPYATNVLSCIDLKELQKRVNYKGNTPNKYNSIKNYIELREFIKTELMYHYWSKAEHEIIVSPLFSHKEEQEYKIDVWAQVSPNLDVITRYVNYELEIDFPIIKKEDDNRFGLKKK